MRVEAQKGVPRALKVAVEALPVAALLEVQAVAEEGVAIAVSTVVETRKEENAVEGGDGEATGSGGEASEVTVAAGRREVVVVASAVVPRANGKRRPSTALVRLALPPRTAATALEKGRAVLHLLSW